jgi:ABC-type microcin C transport system permease subunit YejE
MEETDVDNISLAEALGWAEFCCWSALAMAPLIYWIQGPSVSNDQFVVRTALVIITAIGALGLRARAIIARKRSPAESAGIDTALPFEKRDGNSLRELDER